MTVREMITWVLELHTPEDVSQATKDELITKLHELEAGQ